MGDRGNGFLCHGDSGKCGKNYTILSLSLNKKGERVVLQRASKGKTTSTLPRLIVGCNEGEGWPDKDRLLYGTAVTCRNLKYTR